MEFKDYYAILGIERTATPEEIKRTYRKLARKFHPDVSKEADAEARFKDVSEAYEALSDPEKRAAYDEIGRRRERGQGYEPPPDGGFEFSGRNGGPADDAAFSDFFESIFGHRGRTAPETRRSGGSAADHHAKVQIDLEDAYRGARRTISLRMPVIDDQGQAMLHERQLEVNIPKGVRDGQQLRLAGQGGPGHGGGPAGDLYLEISIKPHAHFRLDGRDLYLDLPITPWEGALGARVPVPTPDGALELGIPAGSWSGRKLRLRGKGLPGPTPGDLYAVLQVTAPPVETQDDRDAYAALAQAHADFNPRAGLMR
ncbi:MAG: DnaJ C-terminal domain-containing protein [Burkholderiaceae bacterium]|nr:DnaJ C-terminal domain-containing protein [Burkholderiaceae bacterium]